MIRVCEKREQLDLKRKGREREREEQRKKTGVLIIHKLPLE